MTPLKKERAAMQEVRAVYRHADAAYAPYSCPASGECCQLSRTGLPPWLWEPEWRVLQDALRRDGRPLPLARADGGCPFLDASGVRCSVYADRPFGCRTYFCHRIQGPARQPAERVGQLLERLERVARSLDEEAKPLPLPEWHRLTAQTPPGTPS